jgi:hypothetical protein
MRFYFNLIGPDGAAVIDDEGVDALDYEEARRGAMRAIEELREETAWAADPWDGWRLVLVDDSGAPLLSLSLAKLLGETGASIACLCLCLASWVSLARPELAKHLADMQPDVVVRFAPFA